MKEKIKVSAVSYLNSKPFIYGLKETGFLNEIDLTEDIPSVCAEKLMNGTTDIGLVPVAILEGVKKPNIISNFCIGANGPVSSVMLFSQVPLNEIKRVYLDDHSRTSARLVRVLAKNFWKINPEWISDESNSEQKINQTDAAMLIGDKCLNVLGKFNDQFDLAEEWKKMTGLPFVFACWVSNKKLSAEFCTDFNNALQYGIDHIADVAALQPDPSKALEYLSKHIQFEFDTEKKTAMKLFLEMKI